MKIDASFALYASLKFAPVKRGVCCNPVNFDHAVESFFVHVIVKHILSWNERVFRIWSKFVLFWSNPKLARVNFELAIRYHYQTSRVILYISIHSSTSSIDWCMFCQFWMSRSWFHLCKHTSIGGNLRTGPLEHHDEFSVRLNAQMLYMRQLLSNDVWFIRIGCQEVPVLEVTTRVFFASFLVWGT